MSLIPILMAVWLAQLAWRRRQIAVPHWKPLAWSAVVGFVLGSGLLLIDLEGQKMAAGLATPLGITWLALAALALAAFRERAWTRAGILAGCWLLLALGCNAWVGAWLLGRLEATVPQPAADRTWDAACVLGGGTGLTPDGHPELIRAGDRIRVGAELWRTHRVPLLVASGSGMLGRDADRDLGEETTTLWRGWDIPESAVVVLPGPVNTQQEVRFLAQLAHDRGWQRVALVSSAWHLPRALALARRYGLPADGYPCDHRGRIPPGSPLFLVPSADGAGDVQCFLKEILGRLIGR